MSQAGVNNTATGPSPPTVATQYTTDSGIAVPALNNLNVFGGSTATNDTDGINTTGAGSTVTVRLSNRQAGSVKHIDVGTSTLLTFTPVDGDGTYRLRSEIAAFDQTTPSGASYELSATIIVSAGVVSLQGTGVRIMEGNATVFDVELVDMTSPTPTTAAVIVTGVAGKTINWGCVLNYVYQGVI